MKSMLRITLGLATVALLAACGGGGGDTGGDTGGNGETGSTLTMVDDAFEPADLTVSAGAAVEVANEGQALHNLTVEGSDIDEDVEAGQSATVTVDLDPGQYRMFCEYHEAQGMEGTLTVQ